MSIPDIAILVIVAASTLYGLSRGGVKEIFSMLAIVVGIAGGIYLHGPVGTALGGSGIAHVISFIVIFVVVAFVVNKIGNTVRTTLKLMFLGGIDRLVGAVVGFVRGVVIVCVIWGLGATYMEDSKKWMKDSKLALPTLKVVEVLSPLFPEGVKDQFEGRYGEAKDYWKDAKKHGKMVEEGLEKLDELEKKVKGD